MKIIFIGCVSFSEKALLKLLELHANVVGIVTKEKSTYNSDFSDLSEIAEKNNIPFPEEIIAIRHKYDLSAAKMCDVLGLGANGYSNYENGEIPTPAYGNLISAASEPQTFMNLLEKAKEHFSEKTFKKVK
jgi:methionyl-tRNA formyltransferase